MTKSYLNTSCGHNHRLTSKYNVAVITASSQHTQWLWSQPHLNTPSEQEHSLTSTHPVSKNTASPQHTQWTRTQPHLNTPSEQEHSLAQWTRTQPHLNTPSEQEHSLTSTHPVNKNTASPQHTQWTRTQPHLNTPSEQEHSLTSTHPVNKNTASPQHTPWAWQRWPPAAGSGTSPGPERCHTNRPLLWSRLSGCRSARCEPQTDRVLPAQRSLLACLLA